MKKNNWMDEWIDGTFNEWMKLGNGWRNKEK